MNQLKDIYSIYFGTDIDHYYVVPLNNRRFIVINITGECPILFDEDIYIGVLSKQEVIDLLANKILETVLSIECRDEVGRKIVAQALAKVCKTLKIKPIYREKEYKIKFKSSRKELKKADSKLWSKIYVGIPLTSSELRKLRRMGFDFEIVEKPKPELDIDKTYEKIVEKLDF